MRRVKTSISLDKLYDVPVSDFDRQKAALWCFLRWLRQSQGDVLKNLAHEVAPQFRGVEGDQWWKAWRWSRYLPNTQIMRHEGERTRRLMGAGGLDGRWFFEFHLDAFLQQLEGQDVAVGEAVEIVSPRRIEVSVAPVPPADASALAWTRWEQEVARRARSVAYELGLALRRPSTFSIGPFLGWLLLQQDSSRVRNVRWLAIKQATGRSYEQLAGDATEEGEGTSDTPVSREGVRKAVRSAAEDIGLPLDRIRRTRSGPRSL